MVKGRFLVRKIRKTTYMLFDRKDKSVIYLLAATPFGTQTHLSLSLVEDKGKNKYVGIIKELWSATLYASNLIDLIQEVIDVVTDPQEDIGNPVSLIISYGGNLLGSPVRLPKPNTPLH